jgi:hypothetical protein
MANVTYLNAACHKVSMHKGNLNIGKNSTQVPKYLDYLTSNMLGSAALKTTAQRAMSVALTEAKPMTVAIIVVRAMRLTTMAAMAVVVAMKTVAVTLAAAAAMVMAELRASATAVTSSAMSGSGNGMTMDICNANLSRCADVVNVKSDDDGNCAPALEGGNIDGGFADEHIKNQEGVCMMQAAIEDQWPLPFPSLRCLPFR